MNSPKDLITVTEARKLLGISPLTMTRLLRSGKLRYFPNLLDRRSKLVSKAETLALIPPRAEAA